MQNDMLNKQQNNIITLQYHNIIISQYQNNIIQQPPKRTDKSQMANIIVASPQVQKLLKQQNLIQDYIQLHLHNKNYFNQIYYVSKDENLQIIYHQISKNSLFCLFKNVYYEFNKEILSDTHKPICQIFPYDKNSKDNSFFVEVQFGPYNVQTLKLHCQKVKGILMKPAMYKFLQLNSFVKCREERKVLQYTLNNRTTTQFHPPIQTIRKQFTGQNLQMEKLFNYDFINKLRQNKYKGGKNSKLVEYFDVVNDFKLSHKQFLMGHLGYFKLITLQERVFYITGTQEGFSINKSTQQKFDTTIVSQRPFLSLLDLFASVSEKYTKVFNQHLSQLTVDLVSLTQSSNNQIKPSPFWLTKNKNISQHVYRHNFDETIPFINYPEGACTAIYDKIKEYSTLQTFARNRVLKINKLTGFQCPTFVSLHVEKDNFLKSYAKKMEEFTVHMINNSGSGIQYPNSVQPRMDGELIDQDEYSEVLTYVKNITLFFKMLQTDDIHPINASIVQYIGKRIFTYQFIPDRYLQSCVKFGKCSGEEGYKFIRNQEFQVYYKKIADQLSLQYQILYYNKEYIDTAIISPHIRGISYMNNKFITDLGRFSVRDLNYLGSENQGCFVRFELLKKFRQSKNKIGETCQKFNVNIEVDDVKLVQTEKLTDQIQTLFQVADYIRTEAIPELIAKLKSQSHKIITGNKDISECFHQFGVNMRYLGQVCQHEDLKQNPETQIFFKRIMITRSLKRYFRMVMKQSKTYNLKLTVAHILNCVFGRIQALQLIEEELIKKQLQQKEKMKKHLFSSTKIQEPKNSLPRIKPTSLKKQTQKYLNVSPNEVWKSIASICKARFNFQISQSIIQENIDGVFSFPYTKLVVLKELCESIGLYLYQKNYDIIQNRIIIINCLQKDKINQNSERKALKNQNIIIQAEIQQKEETKNTKLPFQADDIVEFRPIVKFIVDQFPQQELYQFQHLEAAQCFAAYQVQNPNPFALITSKMQPLIPKAQFLQHMEYYHVIFLRMFQGQGIPFSYFVNLSYSRVSMANIIKNNLQIGLYFALKSLFLMFMNYGETCNAFSTVLTISKIYQNMNLPNNAIAFLQRMLQILKPVYGDYHMNISLIYSNLAATFYKNKQFMECVQHQNKATQILKTICKPNDKYLTDAESILSMYRMSGITHFMNDSNQQKSYKALLLQKLDQYIIKPQK